MDHIYIDGLNLIQHRKDTDIDPGGISKDGAQLEFYSVILELGTESQGA